MESRSIKIKNKKCKACGNNFTPSPFNSLQVVCSKNCEYEYKTKIALNNLKKIKQQDKIRFKELSIEVHSKDHKKTLQKEINELARMIDQHCEYTSCIDCGKDLTNQIHGSHYKNVQGHENIRFNLLNIHSSRSECNKYHGGRKDGYEKGLVQRYSQDALNEIEDLDIKYKSSHFTNKEIFEKIKIVRKLKRDLSTFTSTDGIFLRKLLNTIIGLYK
jgi:hypothetical protein